MTDINLQDQDPRQQESKTDAAVGTEHAEAAEAKLAMAGIRTGGVHQAK